MSNKMLDIDKIRDWLLENSVNEDGDLDLGGLDFSKFDGDVIISDMRVKGNLYQSEQAVGGNLHQDNQTVEGDIYQSFNESSGKIDQRYSKGTKGVDQRGTFSGGDVLSGGGEIHGNYLYKEDDVYGVVARIEEYK